MGETKIYKCIYCLQEKDESQFNKEHVVPQMMGKYNNGYVLSHNQVCQECNSFFCSELENKIGLDSFEAFLRTQYRSKPLSDGHTLRKQRLKVSGAENIFKDLPFDVITDSSNPYRMSLNPKPLIGILKSIETQEYDYYDLDTLPQATEEKLELLKLAKTPIINTGLPEEEATLALKNKGYPVAQYSRFDATTLYDRSEFLAKIDFKIDSLVRRVCAKTVFNYFCYKQGVDFVLNSKFDAIRNYIRYGTWSDELWFNYSMGPMQCVDLNGVSERSHIVGCLLYPENMMWNLCGSVTWFGELTYSIGLAKEIQPILPGIFPDITTVSIFDNTTREIITDDSIFLYCGRTKQ